MFMLHSVITLELPRESMSAAQSTTSTRQSAPTHTLPGRCIEISMNKCMQAFFKLTPNGMLAVAMW